MNKYDELMKRARRMFANAGEPSRRFTTVLEDGSRHVLVLKEDYDAAIERAEDAERELGRAMQEVERLRAQLDAGGWRPLPPPPTEEGTATVD